MDCGQARLGMVAHLSRSEAAEQREALQMHLQACPGCRTEAEALARTWDALGQLADAEVPPEVWERIQAALLSARPAPRPPAWPAAAATAALAALLSIAASWLLPYERAVALCSETLRGLLAASLPDPAMFFAVGLLYSLLPLGTAAAVAARRLLRGAGHPGLVTGLVFTGFALPYVVIACIGLPVAFTAALMTGILAGALAGGSLGIWAGGRFLTPVQP